MAPVGTGLMVAAIAAIFQVTGAGLLSWIVAAGAALAMNFIPDISPLLLLLLLGGGAAVFLAVAGNESFGRCCDPTVGGE